jgi:6-phosphofructokinase 2
MICTVTLNSALDRFIVVERLLMEDTTRILTDCVRLSCAAGTATAQTPGIELYHRAGVEAILPRVGLSFL